MKRTKTLLQMRLSVLTGLLLSCGASLAQPAPAAPVPAAIQQAQPAPATEVIRVAWDRVGATA